METSTECKKSLRTSAVALGAIAGIMGALVYLNKTEPKKLLMVTGISVAIGVVLTLAYTNYKINSIETTSV